MPKLIDVPATLNNCFFHCLATHFLLNDIAFPDAVFDLRNTPFDTLALVITDQASFDSVFQLESQMRAKDKSANAFIVEKMLLLGVLLRHYYVKQLKSLAEEGDLYHEIESRFIQHLETVKEVAAEEGEIDEICSTTEDDLGLLLQVNREYVVAYLTQLRAQDKLVDVLDKQPEPSEYFKQTGFRTFIQALEKDSDTLSISDASPLTKLLGIDVHVFIDEEEVKTDIVHDRCEFQIKEGHYFLKVPEDERSQQLEQDLSVYKEERKAILGEHTSRQSKEEKANQSDCLFLAATFPVDEDVEGENPVESLQKRWSAILDSQNIRLPLLAISEDVQAFLDSDNAGAFLHLEDTVKERMVDAFIAHQPDVIQKIQEISARMPEETKVYARDKVLDNIIGETIAPHGIQERIHQTLREDLIQCHSQNDYWAFKDKYAFLNADSLKRLDMLHFFQEMISDREQRFNELIAGIADESLKQRLRDYYQALHTPDLSLSRKLTLYQLVLETFSPLNIEDADIVQFEYRLQQLKQTAKQLEGHAKPVLKYLGVLMLAVVVGVGIALAIGSLGVGAACLAGTGALLLSLGFFSSARSKSVAKKTEQIVKLAKVAPSLIDKLAQTLGHDWLQESEGQYVTELNDIAEANRLALSFNERFSATKMKAKPEIDSLHRYRVVLSNVSYQRLEKIRTESHTVCGLTT